MCVICVAIKHVMLEARELMQLSPVAPMSAHRTVAHSPVRFTDNIHLLESNVVGAAERLMKIGKPVRTHTDDVRQGPC